MTDTALDDTLTAKDVADYLRRHPGFLNEFPDLAAQLELPREQGGQVASLAAYQTQNLREKNAELERRLAELAAIAAENERLMLRIHELNVAVLRANTAAVAARSVIARLSEDFQTDQVRLLVYDLELPPADWLVRAPDGAASLPEFAEFFAHHEPVAGRLSAERLYRLFGDEAPQIQSSALMPLDGVGLLAIGSRDPDRFQPGMGTVFLKMIATTVTAALQRTRSDA